MGVVRGVIALLINIVIIRQNLMFHEQQGTTNMLYYTTKEAV